MALNGKYTGIRTIIDEVYRDNGYTIEVPWQDSVEWIYDAMSLIRVPMQYLDRKVKLTITDYKAALPCDYHLTVQVAGSFGGCFPFPMVVSTNTFHPTKDQCDLTTDYQYLNGLYSEETSSELTPIGQDAFGNPVYELEPNTNYALNANSVVTGYNIELATYKINEDYIFTNFKDGYVYIAYKAFPVDEEGLPMIPEDQKFVEAVKAYIRMKIDFKLWRKGDITKDIYQDAQQQWAWKVGQAQNGARIPTIDQMESWKNMNKLVQNRFQHNKFFRNLGN